MADRVLGEAVDPDGLRKELLRGNRRSCCEERSYTLDRPHLGEKPGHLLPPAWEALAELLEAPAGKGDMARGRRVISHHRHLDDTEEDGENLSWGVMLPGRQLI